MRSCVGAALPFERRPRRFSPSLSLAPHFLSLSYPDLYAIVKTTEKLERAYVRDAISAAEYEPACEKLIGQFRTLWETLRDTVRGRRGREGGRAHSTRAGRSAWRTPSGVCAGWNGGVVVRETRGGDRRSQARLPLPLQSQVST